MIGTSILAFFITVSATISGIATYLSRRLLFEGQLSYQDITLLTLIFAVVASLVFVTICPIRINGERK